MSSTLTTLCRRLFPSHSLHPVLHPPAARLGVCPRSSACICKCRCRPGPGRASAYSRGTWSASVVRDETDRCRSERHWESKQKCWKCWAVKCIQSWWLSPQWRLDSAGTKKEIEYQSLNTNAKYMGRITICRESNFCCQQNRAIGQSGQQGLGHADFICCIYNMGTAKTQMVIGLGNYICLPDTLMI